MTEAEWLAATDPERMVEFLRDWTTPRKKRAFIASACRVPFGVNRRARPGRCRRNLHPDDVLRRFCGEVACWVEVGGDVPGGPMFNEFHSLISTCYRYGLFYLWIRVWRQARVVARDTASLEEKAQVIARLRCLFGNPWRVFRSTPFDTSWLSPTVAALATTFYEDRAFDGLPILADALADAGCEDAELLGHLRGPGPHAQGCWGLDLILSKY